MAGGFYRQDTSLTRQLQTSSFTNSDQMRPQIPMSQSSHTQLHQNSQYTQRFDSAIPSAQFHTQQFEDLFSRMDALMTMINSTQQLAFSNQAATHKLQDNLDNLTKEIEEIKNLSASSSIQPDSGSRNKKVYKISSELSSAVKKLHENGSEKFASDQLYHSEHNIKVANFLWTQLKEEEFSKLFEDKLLKRAIHRYYESRRRTFNDSQPRRASSVAENKRRAQKIGYQKRLYSQRTKRVKGEAEKEKWASIDYRYMTEESDHESDEENIVRQHKLQWRSQELNTLIQKLEEHQETTGSHEEGGRFIRKQRRMSAPSTQLPPKEAPSWALRQQGTPQGETGVGAGARRMLRDQL